MLAVHCLAGLAFVAATSQMHGTPDLATEVDRRTTPQPNYSFDERLVLNHGGPYAVPNRTYVDCAQPATPAFVAPKPALRTDSRWSYLAVPAGHEVMWSHPQLIADVLLSLA